MNSIYKLSADGGNSGIKIVLEGGEQYLNIPNVVAKVGKVDYKIDNNLAASKTGINRLDVTVTKNCDKKDATSNTFLIGQMTAQFKKYAKNRHNADKSNDMQLIDSMLASMAYSIINYKKNNKETLSKHMVVKAYLSTGLPYHEWKLPTKNEIFKDNLEGKHRVEFNNPFFKDELGVEIVDLIIVEVLVNTEGACALTYYINDEESGITDLPKTSLLERIAINVNIGAYTTEVIGMQFIPKFADETADMYSDDNEFELIPTVLGNLSKGIVRGIGHVMDDIISEIAIEYPEMTDNLIRYDIERAYTKVGYRSDENGKGKYGYLVGTDINIDDITTKHATIFGEYIAGELYGLYNDSNVKSKIIKIYLSGGGSNFEVVVNKLIEILGANGYDTKKISPVRKPDPVYSDAIGYADELEVVLSNREESEDIA